MGIPTAELPVIRRGMDEFQRYFGAVNVIIVTLQASQAVTQINRKGSEVLGYSADEIIGKNWFDTVIPERMREQLREQFVRRIQGEIAENECQESPVLAKSGEERIVLWHTTLIKDAGGKIAGILNSGEDVTQYRSVEMELLRRTRQLEILSNTAQNINAVLEIPLVMRNLVTSAMELVDAEGGFAGLVREGKMVIREYNRKGMIAPFQYSFPAGWGVPGLVLSTARAYIAQDAEHDPHVAPEFRQALGFHNLVNVPVFDKKGALAGCFEIHDKRGRRPFTDDDLSLLKGLAATAATTIENARIMEHLQQSEEALERERKFLRKVIDAVPAHIFVKDTEGRYVLVNEALARFYGTSVEGVTGKTDTDFGFLVSSGQGQRSQETDCAVMRDRTELRAEIMLKGANGKQHWFTVDKVPLMEEDGTCGKALGVATDVTELKRYQEQLQQGAEKIRHTVMSIIDAIAKLVEMRDPYTAGHQRHVSQLASAIAREMGLPGEQVEVVRIAGFIHDVGKLNVPAEILSKPGRLTRLDFEIIKIHPTSGYEILKLIDFPWPVAEVAREHQERIDGSGYPRGLKGEEICLEARIVSVADVVEAMTFPRPYRPVIGLQRALTEIGRGKGILYYAPAVEACVQLFKERKFDFT